MFFCCFLGGGGGGGFACQITVKYTNVNIKNSEDPLSTHFFKIRLKAQPEFTRVKPMGKPGERWALRTRSATWRRKSIG